MTVGPSRSERATKTGHGARSITSAERSPGPRPECAHTATAHDDQFCALAFREPDDDLGRAPAHDACPRSDRRPQRIHGGRRCRLESNPLGGFPLFHIEWLDRGRGQPIRSSAGVTTATTPNVVPGGHAIEPTNVVAALACSDPSVAIRIHDIVGSLLSSERTHRSARPLLSGPKWPAGGHSRRRRSGWPAW